MNNDVETIFIDLVERGEIPVTIYLVNGVKLEGKIDAYDDLSILLVRDGHSQLVYKNSISTIMPHKKTEFCKPPKEPEQDYEKEINTKQGWW